VDNNLTPSAVNTKTQCFCFSHTWEGPTQLPSSNLWTSRGWIPCQLLCLPELRGVMEHGCSENSIGILKYPPGSLFLGSWHSCHITVVQGQLQHLSVTHNSLVVQTPFWELKYCCIFSKILHFPFTTKISLEKIFFENFHISETKIISFQACQGTMVCMFEVIVNVLNFYEVLGDYLVVIWYGWKLYWVLNSPNFPNLFCFPSLDVGWFLSSMLICSDFQFEAEVLGSNFDFIQK
jgi:hypothetical protein